MEIYKISQIQKYEDFWNTYEENRVTQTKHAFQKQLGTYLVHQKEGILEDYKLLKQVKNLKP